MYQDNPSPYKDPRCGIWIFNNNNNSELLLLLHEVNNLILQEGAIAVYIYR